MALSAPSWHHHLSFSPVPWPQGVLKWKPLEGLKVWLWLAPSDPPAGMGASPVPTKRFNLPWTQSRPKSKGGFFLKQRPEIGTQRALCFGVEAFKDLFSLNILLQEREARNQTFLT